MPNGNKVTQVPLFNGLVKDMDGIQEVCFDPGPVSLILAKMIFVLMKNCGARGPAIEEFGDPSSPKFVFYYDVLEAALDEMAPFLLRYGISNKMADRFLGSIGGYVEEVEIDMNRESGCENVAFLPLPCNQRTSIENRLAAGLVVLRRSLPAILDEATVLEIKDLYEEIEGMDRHHEAG